MKRKAWIIAGAGLVIVGVILGIAHYINSGTNTPNDNFQGWTAATRQKAEQAHNQALALINRSQFAEARLVLEQHLTEVGDDAQGYELLTQALIGQGRLERAYAAAAKAADLANSAHNHFIAGSLAHKLHRTDPARAHFERAVEQEPDNVKYTLYLANLLVSTYQFEAAEPVARRVLELDPTVSRAHYILGEAAASRGELDDAIAHIDRALQHVEPMSLTHLSYTLTRAKWLRRGDATDQREALQTLTSLPEPRRRRNRSVANELAITLNLLGEPDRAAERWSEWFADHPDDAGAAAEAGMYWLKAGEREKAKRFLMLARRLKPHHPLVGELAQAMGEDFSR